MKEAPQKLSHDVSAISPPTYSTIFPLRSVSYECFEEKLADRVLKHKSSIHQRSRLKVKARHSWPIKVQRSGDKAHTRLSIEHLRVAIAWVGYQEREERRGVTRTGRSLVGTGQSWRPSVAFEYQFDQLICLVWRVREEAVITQDRAEYPFTQQGCSTVECKQGVY